jgi:hypothetical protein
LFHSYTYILFCKECPLKEYSKLLNTLSLYYLSVPPKTELNCVPSPKMWKVALRFLYMQNHINLRTDLHYIFSRYMSRNCMYSLNMQKKICAYLPNSPNAIGFKYFVQFQTKSDHILGVNQESRGDRLAKPVWTKKSHTSET